MTVARERADELPHRAKIRLVGRPRILLDVLEAEGTGILAELDDVLFRVLPQIHPRLLRSDNRPIVHVGEVHDMTHVMTEQVLQGPAQHVNADEGAEVADVAAGVDGRTTGVQPHGVGARRRKGLFSPSQGVV